MKKILLATPMMPPTAGGPATHAKKLYEFFGSQAELYTVDLFNFETVKNSRLRHLKAFFKILKLGRGKDIIFCLDGFSVALPAILANKFLNKKIVLRIGGDLVHEQYVEEFLVPMDLFYEKLKKGEIKLGWKLNLKLSVQKYVLRKASKIIFTTNWQKEIYEKFYQLPKTIVINNPADKIDRSVYVNIPYDKKSDLTFTSITRQVAFKNQAKIREAIDLAKQDFPNIYLDTELGSWESCLKRISMSRAYICASISDISPNQVLESLSLGIPVIMTKNSGFYELLKDKGVARFIDPFNLDDIKNAILEMCQMQIYNEYKKNAEEFNEKNLWPENWTTLFAKYEIIIDEKV